MSRVLIGKEYVDIEINEKEAEQAERKYWANINYDEAVSEKIREKYPQRAVEAILNNYLSFPENAEYIREFLELQEYRVECKAFVKRMKEM